MFTTPQTILIVMVFAITIVVYLCEKDESDEKE